MKKSSKNSKVSKKSNSKKANSKKAKTPKVVTYRWGLVYEELGIVLMFSSKRKSVIAKRAIEKIKNLNKKAIVNFANENGLGSKIRFAYLK